MQLPELEQKVRDSLNDEYGSLDNFREKYFFTRAIKNKFPHVPESIIFMVVDRLSKKYDYSKDKDLFIKEFLNQIFPILSDKK